MTATITDPTVFTRPWTMGWNFVRNRQATGAAAEIWEHGCPEGNRFQVWDEMYERELGFKVHTR